MDLTELLAFTAQTKGATGVRTFLRERRQQVPDVLVGLSQPVVLEAGDPAVRIEQLPLRAQREVWSALASDSLGADAVKLARSYLRVAAQRTRGTDGVCVALARMVAGDQKHTEAKEDAAFRRRMRRMTMGRVVFPSRDEESGGIKPSMVSSHLHKRTTEMPHGRPTARAKGEESSSDESMDEESADAEVQEQPPLTKEMEDRASMLAKQLIQLSRAEAPVEVDDTAAKAFAMLSEVVSDVHTTYAANERSFQYLCQLLRVDATSDDALLHITTSLVESNWSSRYAAVFLETCVLPKIRAADSVISRALLQTALRFGSSYAGALFDSLLLPLFVGDAAGGIGPAQAEAITRILRSPDAIPTDQLDGFIQKSLEAAAALDQEGSSCGHLLSNESALLVFQNILNVKPVLSALTVEKFVGACEVALERPEGESLRGSLKFATVLFTLISKYPQQCTGHLETLGAITTKLTSIMAKTTLRSLEKLKASN